MVSLRQSVERSTAKELCGCATVIVGKEPQYISVTSQMVTPHHVDAPLTGLNHSTVKLEQRYTLHGKTSYSGALTRTIRSITCGVVGESPYLKSTEILTISIKICTNLLKSIMQSLVVAKQALTELIIIRDMKEVT